MSITTKDKVNWRVQLADKRLIFTVSTGRCGTGYLASLLRLLPGVESFHEPLPDFASVMRDAQHDPRCARQFWTDHKLPAIAACEAPVYVETSHLFCKGFAEPLWELGVNYDLLHIHRPHRDVALSLFRLDTIPGRTPGGLAYCLMPDDDGVLPLDAWNTLHDYQLCYWYCLEIERRAETCLQEVQQRGGRDFRVTLADVSQHGGAELLVESMGLKLPAGWNRLRWAAAKHRVVNKRRQRREAPPASELDRLELDVQQRAGASLTAA